MAFTDSVAVANQIVTAYDRSAFMALRAEAVFDQFAKVRPGDLSNPGTPVRFAFWSDLTPATAALNETVDIEPVALADSTLTITPKELGNAILVTIKARTDSLLIGFDADAADIIGYNMADSLEHVARQALDAGGTAVAINSSGAASNTAGDVLTMAMVRQQVAKLRGASVKPFAGSMYATVVHPDVAYDLMSETTLGSWGGLHTRQDPAEWYAGQVGTAAGVIFLESPRALIDPDGGASNVDNYTSYIFGDEAFGKAESIPPGIVPGPVTDLLRRFVPLGWYAYLNYGVIRAAALRRVVSASSIGANS